MTRFLVLSIHRVVVQCKHFICRVIAHDACERWAMLNDCEGQSSSTSAAGRQQHRLYARRTAAQSRLQHHAVYATTAVLSTSGLPPRATSLSAMRSTQPLSRYEYVSQREYFLCTMGRRWRSQEKIIGKRLIRGKKGATTYLTTSCHLY